MLKSSIKHSRSKTRANRKTDLKDGRNLPPLNKESAERFIKQAVNTVDHFNKLQLNLQRAKLIKKNGIQGYLELDRTKEVKKLEQRHLILKAYCQPTSTKKVGGKKIRYWNKGGGSNPFLACWVWKHEFEQLTPSYLVRRLVLRR